MSRIELLMKELNLRPDTIEKTMNKINEICQCENENAGKFYFIRLSGNGDGDN